MAQKSAAKAENSIELKDYTTELENEESSISLKDDNESESEQDDKVSKPLLTTTASNADEIEMIQMVPNQASDPAAIEDQAEQESLLVNETNLDEIQLEPIPTEEVNSFPSLKLPKMSLQSLLSFGGAGLCIILGLVVLVVIIPSCIDSLDYDEYALRRNRITGSVSQDDVYEPGLHLVSPFSEWIKFKKTVHPIRINGLTLFTTDKLQVNATFVVYYFLNKEQIGKMFKNFGLDYQPLIERVVKSEIQILGQLFSIDDYRLKRAYIKKFLKDKIAKRLSIDYGIKLHDLLMLQLRFSSRINQLNLKRMIVGIQNEEAAHYKTANMVRQETDYQTAVLRNKALLEQQTAELKGNNTIIKIYQIDYDNKIELANLDGLTKSLKGLDFYNPATKDINKKVLSFCWVSSLVNNENLVIHNNGFNSKNAPNELSPNFGFISM